MPSGRLMGADNDFEQFVSMTSIKERLCVLRLGLSRFA